MEKKYSILLYYCYTQIENPEEFREQHHRFCLDNNLRGRIIIAPEGLNGTVSGRLTSPLHTIPREGGFRNIFITPPGFKFVGMDYKQFELRIAAFLAGDKELLSILDSPGTKEILTKLITGEEYTEEGWVNTKSIIYGTLYGMGPKRSAAELGIEVSEAEDLRESFFKNFKSLWFKS